MKMLILRPEPGAEASALRAIAAGLEPLKLPLFTVQKMTWHAQDPAQYDAILFTSANALRHGGGGLSALTSLPAYAVGPATAKLAGLAGFNIAGTGKSGSAELIQLAKEQGHRRLLWLTGEDHSQIALPDDMNMTKQIIYRSQRAAPPEGLRNLLAVPVAAALYSPRAARYFAELCEEWHIDRLQITLACLSSKIAQAAGNGWNHILVPDHPNDAEMLTMAKSYFTSMANAP